MECSLASKQVPFRILPHISNSLSQQRVNFLQAFPGKIENLIRGALIRARGLENFPKKAEAGGGAYLSSHLFY